MWIVRLALPQPCTFVVASLVLLLLTPFVLLRTPTDMFPAINIPVVSIAWQYTGLDAQETQGGAGVWPASPPASRSVMELN